MKVLFEDQDSVVVPEETPLMNYVAEYQKHHEHPIVLALVNNRLVDLWYKPVRDCRINFIDLGTIDGIRSYRQSLVFLLLRAFKETYPKATISVAHSLGRAFFFRAEGVEITEEILKNVSKRMHEIVGMDEPFVRTRMLREDAIREMQSIGQDDKVRLLKWIRQKTIHVYSFGTLKDHFFMPLVPSSGYLKHFSLELFKTGFLLRFPRHSTPGTVAKVPKYNKLFDIFQEYERWGKILEINDVGHLNEAIASGQIDDIIKISEALHEKKIAYIADNISSKRPNIKLILIAGPSSSGKTTFSKRLSIQLRVNMLNPFTIEMDDYFVPRTSTPRLPNGDFDYENIKAIDIDLFNYHLSELLDGRAIELPKYDFSTGQRLNSGKLIQLRQDDVLIVEGIHGLNDALTPNIPKDLKFKVYVSALTHLNIDNHNRFSTTDTRLIRRIVRDSHFRSYTALDTLRRWPLVREGEDRWIFPFQEEANVMFNSALVYEQSVLKGFAIPVLQKIPRTELEYSEARRLVDLLSCFMEVSTAEVPNTSILREFVGGSSFRY
ncbi:nucleoside kinase [bacterium]|nr:nucleoside kinase [candidate division CSSED10-310 bacterium]